MAKKGLSYARGKPYEELFKCMDSLYDGLFDAEKCLRYMLDSILDGSLSKEIGEGQRTKMVALLGAYERAVMNSAPFEDVLGRLYMHAQGLGGKKQLGQYFTPPHVAQCMAKMNVQPAGKKPDGGLWSAADPCCGSGVMMLYLAQAIFEAHGREELKNWSFTGIDIDQICAKMFAVQFFANVAIHEIEIGEIRACVGNSLMPHSEWRDILHIGLQDNTGIQEEEIEEINPKETRSSDEALFG